MRTKFIVILYILSVNLFCLKTDKISGYFDDPILIKETNVLIIPTRYDENYLKSGKIRMGKNCYSNILFYNSELDSTYKLFEKNVYIKPLTDDIRRYSYFYNPAEPKKEKSKHFTSNWIFYLVNAWDSNNNGKITDEDPTYLYASNLNGTELKCISPKSEHVIDFFVYEKLGYILLKMQRDDNGDNKFNSKDRNYYLKIDLKTLEQVRSIEVN